MVSIFNDANSACQAENTEYFACSQVHPDMYGHLLLECLKEAYMCYYIKGGGKDLILQNQHYNQKNQIHI